MNQLYLKKWIFPLLLLLYHLCFSVIGYRYIVANNGDATRYWFLGEDLTNKKWIDFLHPGTDFIKFFTFPLLKYFHLPFWSGFLLFSLFSFSGIYLFYRLLMKIANHQKWLQILAMGVLLLPNLHFWTSLIGKEAVVFPLIVLFIWETYHKRYFSFLLFFSVLFLAVIRPHVAFVLLAAYVIGLLSLNQLSKKTKIITAVSFIFSTAVFAFILSRLQDFSGGISRIIKKYEVHISHFKTTDAYVPLDRYPLPYKIFTFYFRPLPLEKEGLFYQILSAENIILLLLFVGVIFCFSKYFKALIKNPLIVISVLFLFLMALMYVYAYANYGIIMRTRIMAVPFLYVIILEVFATVMILHSTNRERRS